MAEAIAQALVGAGAGARAAAQTTPWQGGLVVCTGRWFVVLRPDGLDVCRTEELRLDVSPARLSRSRSSPRARPVFFEQRRAKVGMNIAHLHGAPTHLSDRREAQLQRGRRPSSTDEGPPTTLGDLRRLEGLRSSRRPRVLDLTTEWHVGLGRLDIVARLRQAPDQRSVDASRASESRGTAVSASWRRYVARQRELRLPPSPRRGLAARLRSASSGRLPARAVRPFFYARSRVAEAPGANAFVDVTTLGGVVGVG